MIQKYKAMKIELQQKLFELNDKNLQEIRSALVENGSINNDSAYFDFLSLLIKKLIHLKNVYNKQKTSIIFSIISSILHYLYAFVQHDSILAIDLVSKLCDPNHFIYRQLFENKLEIQTSKSEKVKNLVENYQQSHNNKLPNIIALKTQQEYQKQQNTKQKQKWENILKDVEDKQTLQNETIYAQKTKDVNQFYIQIINQVGAIGYFDFVVQRLNQKTRFPFIQIAEPLLNIMDKVQKVFIKKQKFGKLLTQGIRYMIEQSPESNLRKISKQKFQKMLEIIKKYLFNSKLFKQEKEAQIMQFKQYSSLTFLKSKFLDKKILGIKLLAEICYEMNNKCIGQSKLKNFIENNNLFSLIYDTNNHINIIEKSAHFLRYCLRNSLVQTSHLLKIYNFLKSSDNQCKKIIFKLLSQVSMRFHNMHSLFLIQKFNEQVDQYVSEQLIDIIYDLSRFSENVQFCFKCFELLQKIIRQKRYKFSEKLEQKLVRTSTEVQNHIIEKNNQFIVKIIQSSIGAMESREFDKMSITYFKVSLSSVPEKYVSRQQIFNIILIQQNILKIILSHLTCQFMDEKMDLLFFILEQMKFYPVNLNQLSGEEIIEFVKQKLPFSQFVVFVDRFCAMMDRKYKLAQTVMSFVQDQYSQLKIKSVKSLISIFLNINNEQAIKFKQKSMNCEVQGKDVPVRQQVQIICLKKCQQLKYYSLMEKIFYQITQLLNKKQLAILIITLHKNRRCSLTQLQVDFFDLIKNNMIILSKFMAENRQNQILSVLILLETFMDYTEFKGIGKSFCHGSLVKAQQINLNIQNNLTNCNLIPKKLNIWFPKNRTVYELIKKISKLIKFPANELILCIQDKNIVISREFHGRSFQNILEKYNIQHSCQLKVERLPPRQIPPAKFFNQNNEVNPKLIEIFKSWFNQHSNNGKMTKKDCVSFVQKCTHEQCIQTDQNIKQAFRFDQDNKGYLTQNQFVTFFSQAAKISPNSLWKNLYIMKYRNDLRKINEYYDEDQQQEEIRVRDILIYLPNFYETILYLCHCENKSISMIANSILERLPTYSTILKEVLNECKLGLDQISIDYKLTIIEYLLENRQDDDYINIVDRNQVENWKWKFRNEGGYKELKNYAEKLSQRSLSEMSQREKHILNLSFKIFSYLNKIPSLLQPLSKIREQTFQININVSSPIFIRKTIQILNSEMCETYLLHSCFQLLISGVISQPAQFRQGIFSEVKEIRILTTNFLYIQVLKDQHFISKIFEIEIQSQNCHQFAELCCQLINFLYTHHKQLPKSLIFKLDLSFRNHVPIQRNNLNLQDRILQAYLKIWKTLIQNKPHILKEHNFSEMLFFSLLTNFSQPALIQSIQWVPNNYIKYFHNNTRKLAYNLLLIYYQFNQLVGKKHLEFIINQMNRLPLLKTNYKRQPFKVQNLTGIQNIGCICYMNAMLQQFFHIRQFRNTILLIKDNLQPIHKQYKKELVDDNILHQLQRMFLYLMNTNREDYNPKDFCFSFKDYDGNPVNIGVQQDTQEFINMFFDKLQTSLQKTPFKHLLQQIFGGRTCNQMICKNCKTIRSVTEAFFCLSIEVKERKFIYESFEKLINGQVISDFFCENCEQKCDTLRRSLLQRMPRQLLIHLQRITLDLQSFANQKIHSYLQFPEELDLYQFSFSKIMKQYYQKEGKQIDMIFEEKNSDQDQYKFRLKGVVVHSGTAHNGHYYSFIQVKNNTWFKFDDSRVSPFDPRNIPSQCYGGKSQQEVWDQNQNHSRNAYVLVYQKFKNKQELILKVSSQDKQQLIKQGIQFDQSDLNAVCVNLKELQKYRVQDQLMKVVFVNSKSGWTITIT